MYIAILGRQPVLGISELERVYGSKATRWFSDQSACVEADSLFINQLGGTQKAGRIVAELASGDWRRVSMKIVQVYTQAWSDFDGKLTLGISAYGFDVDSRDVQKTGIILKQRLKKSGISMRLIPNNEPALSSATSHHNKLGLSNNKVELIVVRARSGRVIIAESTGSQNITAYTRRDQERPKRDAFVGMLPPKLAQIMVNLAAPTLKLSPDGEKSPSGSVDGLLDTNKASWTSSVTALEMPSHSADGVQDNLQPELDRASGPLLESGAKPVENGIDEVAISKKQGANTTLTRLLDPFCGTGVILQEAALMGYATYGTDLSDKMIDFSRVNMQWLADSHHLNVNVTLRQGDAMDMKWEPPIDAVTCESYLGQPFSAPPSPSKLDEVRKNCDHIITAFLKNIAGQLRPGTPLCVAIPAWRNAAGQFTHLPLINRLEQLGYTQHEFKNVDKKELLYYREDQIVARELLVLVKS